MTNEWDLSLCWISCERNTNRGCALGFITGGSGLFCPFSQRGEAMVKTEFQAIQQLKHPEIRRWASEIAALTNPVEVKVVTGSAAEWDEITSLLISTGTIIPLKKRPNSFWCASDPSDVARVEDRTFICSVSESDAGPTNNWMAPVEMKKIMSELYRDSMSGRTMYLIPFCMGPLDAKTPMYGVQLTDSPYVVASMRIMTRAGEAVLDQMGTDAKFVKALHSVGAPLAAGEPDVPWPCNSTKYISHFPETREIWSYGSGYGGNSLLGKKCYSLRIASAIGRDEGWLAEHMLILKLTSPKNTVHYVAAAFPSACGKTNLAMLEPTIPGWKAETLGDDIAWLRFGDDGRLYAVNPETGLFGVAPGTGWETNSNAMKTLEQGNTIFTNVALTADGDVWWEGMTEQPPANLTDWKGRKWDPTSTEPSAHPNSRFCTPIAQCPTIAAEWNDPAGVPLSAIIFGGRRADTVPLVVESKNWQHGVFFGATLSSETTAAAEGAVGKIRRDPFAMLPFFGYHVGDYLSHWLAIGNQTSEQKLPKIYYVNWFRKSASGKFLWPGFAENSRVLKWIIERIDGDVSAVETPIGQAPLLADLDLAGLDCDVADIESALRVDAAEWQIETESIAQWFNQIGDKLPVQLQAELDQLKSRL